MTQSALAAPDAATDPRIDPQVRSFLAELNKDSSPFWELPQPKPQEILTGLQNKTPVDMSGVTTIEKTITQDGRTVKLYIMTPRARERQAGRAALHPRRRLDRRQFPESPAAAARPRRRLGTDRRVRRIHSAARGEIPTQMEESYAALKWVAAHAGEFGADGSRIAVAGNSVGGNMTAAWRS